MDNDKVDGSLFLDCSTLQILLWKIETVDDTALLSFTGSKSSLLKNVTEIFEKGLW